MKNPKHRFGDRNDGVWLRDVDSMHKLFPYMMPNRTDNEAVVNEIIDLTAVNEYIKKKNAENPSFKYTFFHVIVAAIMKTMVLRPKLNRFYCAKRLYQRDSFSVSFVVKKTFEDKSEEALAIIKVDPESEVSPIEQIHSKVETICNSVRKEHKKDGSTNDMDVVAKLPRPIIKLLMRVLSLLDYFGLYPKALMKDDPYYCSAFVSNLGSIKMNASYHHIANWGTNSFFAVVGEKKPTAFYSSDGSYYVHDALELSITLDERIADGYYYSKSILLCKKLLENPELLELPISTPVE